MDTSLSKTKQMRISESDFQDNLSLHGIMERFQEVSEDYTEKYACSCAFLRENFGYSWMLALVHLEMYDYPHTGDNIKTTLWPVQRDSILMPWYYELSNSENKIYGVCAQSWMVVDINKRKILRPSDLPAVITPDTEHASPCKLPDKKILMPANMTKIQDYKVLYSDCDMNGHMNNAKYAAMTMNIFPADKHKKHRLREFDCFYKKETSIDHVLEIYSSDINANEVFMYCMDNNEETIRCRFLWDTL